MASGVQVNQQCLTDYQELKLRKNAKYIIFGLNDVHTEIIVTQKSPDELKKVTNQEAYDEFLSHFTKDKCCWAVFDFEFEKEDGGIRNKLCFFAWAPDEARIKQKMIFASSKDALRRSLQAVAVEIQGTDFDEISYESVLEKANKGF